MYSLLLSPPSCVYEVPILRHNFLNQNKTFLLGTNLLYTLLNTFLPTTLGLIIFSSTSGSLVKEMLCKEQRSKFKKLLG